MSTRKTNNVSNLTTQQTTPVDGFPLTADDLISGGDNPYRQVVIPELSRDGKPGVVYMKPPSAKTILEFRRINEDEYDDGLLDLISKTLVNPDTGQPLFNSEQAANIREIRADVFMKLSQEVMSTLNLTSKPGETPQGNASSPMEGTDLPTV